MSETLKSAAREDEDKYKQDGVNIDAGGCLLPSPSDRNSAENPYTSDERGISR